MQQNKLESQHQKQNASEVRLNKQGQKNYLGIWEYIPKNAFLYFPKGEQVKIGKGQKQWRKIFQGNQSYDQFQQDMLLKLQQKLLVSNINPHVWFTKANKLRYLQANKWKKTPTCQSIVQYSKWRTNSFPIQKDSQIQRLLNSGTFYICGRDNLYRPIIVADIGKFNKSDVDLIPSALVLLLEFLIQEAFIEGQVENYILIMNLKQFSFDLKSIVTKILGFTSNSYRGRLFVSYLLGMPTMLKFGWNAIVSNFLSQNTLRKIKISGDLYNDQMWTHIDPETIEQKYGGKLPNIFTQYWPPSRERLLFQSQTHKNNLVSSEQYNQKFQNLQLQNRKVLKHLIRRNTITVHDINIQKVPQEQDPQIKSKKILQSVDRTKLTSATILVQSALIPEDLKCLHTFFKYQKFQKIRY